MPWTQLHSAAKNGDISAITSLLAHGNGLDVADALGKTPLHQAARYGHVAITAALLRHRADVNAVDSSARTALHVSAAAGHAAILDILLNQRADVNARSSRGHAPLHSGIFAGHVEVLTMFMKHGVDMLLENSLGQTPLAMAQDLDEKALVDVLQGTKPQTKPKEGSGMLPLHRAARSGDAILVGTLIAGGAKVDARDSLGQTPMHKLAACSESSPDAGAMVRLLAENGANTCAYDNSGESLLHGAAVHGHTDMIAALVANGADMNAKNGRGQTGLHKASERGHAHVVERLLALRADANAKDGLGRTALQRSRWIGHTAVAAVLTQGNRVDKREVAPVFGGELRAPMEVQEDRGSAEGSRDGWIDALARLLESSQGQDIRSHEQHIMQKSGPRDFCFQRALVGQEPQSNDAKSHADYAVHETLCKTLCASSVPHLLSRFHCSRVVIRSHAAMALGRLAIDGGNQFSAGGEVSSVLEAALRTDASWEVRKEVATALGVIGAADPTCEGALSIRALLAKSLKSDPSEAVEIACHNAFLQLFGACPVSDLLSAIKDRDTLTRKYVVQALGARGAKSPRQLKWQVLDPLEEVLFGDVSWDVREYVPAALVLCGIADPLDVGVGSFSILGTFLDAEKANIVLQQWSKDKGDANLGTKVKEACEEALAILGLHIAFHGWRKIASRSPIFDLPVPMMQVLEN